MTTATHPVSAEEVMALLDGELSAEQAQFVSAHLEQCSECAAVAGDLRDVSKNLVSWSVPVPTLNVKDLQQSDRASSGFERFFSIPARWGFGVITGAMLVAIVMSSGRVMYKRAPMLSEARPEQVTQLQAPSPVNQSSGYPAGGGRDREPLAEAGKREIQNPAVDGSDEEGVGHGYGNGAAIAQLPQPMIARTVSLSIIVKDFGAARASLDVILARHHGYAAQLTASTAENAARSLNGSLRVPAGELGPTTAELKALGRVQNESQNGEEVTQQHADLVARLKNSRETERRLQAILAERTGKISDVLAVEQEIVRVRGEIEQTEAEQKSLEHRVEFATPELNLTEEYKAQLLIPTLSAATRLHNALVEGYRNATETLLGIVLFFAEYCLALLLWALILGLPVVYIWRRFRRSLATA